MAAKLRTNVERALRGKPEVVRIAVETLISGGHLLLEDLPGVGKTTVAAALARSLDSSFCRIQFTSDLLPSDVIGAAIPETEGGRPTGGLIFQPGPLFSHVVLADEINRASPKTQSALLEAMSDGSVSVDGKDAPAPRPLLRGRHPEPGRALRDEPAARIATRPLPGALLDRLSLARRRGRRAARRSGAQRTAPARTRRHAGADPRPARSRLAGEVLDDALIAYLLEIVNETREHEAIAMGASTRAAIALRRAAQVRALCDERDYVIPEDVQDLAAPVLGHRIVVDTRSGADRGSEEAQWILREILDRVTVPL